MVASVITKVVIKDLIPKKLTFGGSSFYLTLVVSCLSPLTSGL